MKVRDMPKQRNETLQALCRDYLDRLRYMAKKHGIDVDSIIRANKNGDCSGTEYECRMLARMVDDERIARNDIPKLLGESYRKVESDGVFDKIKKLRHVGIYSKVSALIYKNKRNENERNKK